MKKELRQTAPPGQNYQMSPSFAQRQNAYNMGRPNMPEPVNESRLERPLPGYSNNVDVSRMSFDQSFQNTSNQLQARNFNAPRNDAGPRSMTNNSFYQENASFTQAQRQRPYDMQVKNSFTPDLNSLRNPSGNRGYDMGHPRGQVGAQGQGYGQTGGNPSGVQNNSFGMGNPPRMPQNNLVRNSNEFGGRNNQGGRGMNPPPQAQFNQPPQVGRSPGNLPMEEIEKDQLEQFSKFLMAKRGDIEAKLRTLPKVCRRVADKREKLQLNKELDEVTNELHYVNGLLRGP